METITNAFVFEDHKHHIYKGNNNYLIFYVTNGTKIIRVQSYLGEINPFCCYEFKGKYVQENLFLAKQCSFKPAEPNLLLLKKIVAVMSKRERQFPTRLWSSMIQSIDKHDFQKDFLPIILPYVDKYADLAFFCFPDVYIFVQDYYEDNRVLLWPFSVCKQLKKQIMENPFDLTFSSPFPEMNGLCLDIERLEDFVPETSQNKLRYDECRAAEFFCYNPVKAKPVSDFDEKVLSNLVAKNFLLVVGNKVVLKRTYQTFLKIRTMNFVPQTNTVELNKWCLQNSGFNFIANKHILLDVSFPYTYEIDDNKQNCILNIELWTISDIGKLLNGRDPSSIYGVGIPTSKGNRLGYNVFHFNQQFHNPVPVIKPLHDITMENVKVKKPCSFLKVGGNIFHNKLIKSVRDVYPETRGRKLTFATDTPLQDVPYDFKKAVNDTNNNIFRAKDRVVFNRHICRTIQDVGLEPIVVQKKRKRRIKCDSTNDYKKDRKVVVNFKGGVSVDFKSVKLNMAHWGLMDYNRVLSLREDIIVFITKTVDRQVVSSLLNCCKQLIVVHTENSITSEHMMWNLTDFTV